jgi:small subunit ribosomal protein S6
MEMLLSLRLVVDPPAKAIAQSIAGRYTSGMNYELTIVLDGKATAAKKTAVTKAIEKALEMGKGKMGEISDWGVKDLFYQIRKSKTGLFLHMPVTMEASYVKQLDNKLKMEENVIRYLIVRSN